MIGRRSSLPLLACRLGEIILIQITRDHAVIELAHLVGTAAVRALKAFRHGQHVDLPRLEIAEGVSDVAVELLGLLGGQESLAVRRVSQYRALSALGLANSSRIGAEEANLIGHARSLGVFARQSQHLLIKVRAPRLKAAVVNDHSLGLVSRLLPQLNGQEGIFLARKGAVQTGSDTIHHHYRLDQNRSRATEGVPQENILRQARIQHHRRRKGLTQGRRAGLGTVAALIERRTRGVDHHRHHVAEQEEFDLYLHPGFGENIVGIAFLQARNHGLFQNALAIGKRGQLRMNAVTSHGERILRTDIVLPRERLHAVEQHGKIGCGVRAHLDEDTLCGAQVQIGTCTIDRLTLKGHATVHRINFLQSECFNFITQITFKPKQAGCDKLHNFPLYVKSL